MSPALESVIAALETANMSIASLIHTLLSDIDYVQHPGTVEIVGDDTDILHSLHRDNRTSGETATWARSLMDGIYRGEVAGIASAPAGLHFNAAKATSEKLESFDLTRVSQTMRREAPLLWRLLHILLNSDDALLKPRKASGRLETPAASYQQGADSTEAMEVDEEEEVLWNAVDGVEVRARRTESCQRHGDLPS